MSAEPTGKPEFASVVATTGLLLGLLGGCAATAPEHPELPRPAAQAFATGWDKAIADAQIATPPPNPAAVPAPPTSVYRPPLVGPTYPTYPSWPTRPPVVAPPVPNPPAPNPTAPNPHPHPPTPPIQPTLPPPPTIEPTLPGAPSEWLPDRTAELRRRKDVGAWRTIVVHHSDSDRGNLAAIRDYHVKVRGWKDAGYNFIIGNGSLSGDGEIEISGRWKRQDDGAHAGVEEFNKFGIGICLVGNLENHPPTPAQMRALAKLISFLCERYNIPRDRKHILGHGETGRPTSCPGKKFPWAELMRRL